MENQFTPGPWRWEISLQSKYIQLCGGARPYDLIVMDFERWGMQGAAPRFLRPDKTHGDLLEAARDYAAIVPGREHHKHWFQTINHPDANLIAAAPDLLLSLMRITDAYSGDRCAEFNETEEENTIIVEARKAINKALNK